MSAMELNTSLAMTGLSQSGFDKMSQVARDAKNETEIDAAAQDFEALFIAEMMKPIFDGIEVDPLFGGGKGEEVFRAQLLEEYGRTIASTGQLGIAPLVKAQLLEMQEVAVNENLIVGDTPSTPSDNEEMIANDSNPL